MSRISLFSLSVLSFATLLLAGCGGPAPTPPAPAESGHGHSGAAPHGGHLIEFEDEKYHAELTHDDATKTISIYLFGGDAKTPTPIADPEITLNLVVGGEPLQVKLAAAKQEGDPEGQASKFTVVDEKALEALEAKGTTGRLNVKIDGKTYTPNVELGEHDHDHK